MAGPGDTRLLRPDRRLAADGGGHDLDARQALAFMRDVLDELAQEQPVAK